MGTNHGLDLDYGLDGDSAVLGRRGLSRGLHVGRELLRAARPVMARLRRIGRGGLGYAVDVMAHARCAQLRRLEHQLQQLRRRERHLTAYIQHEHSDGLDLVRAVNELHRVQWEQRQLRERWL